MTRPVRRRGNSLIELMVVMAIMAILLALAMSGVQKVRAVVGRIYCQNNLRQMALAVHSYEISAGSFPQGIASSTLQGKAKDDEPHPGMSWMGAILEHIGEDPVWLRAESAYVQDKYPYHCPPHPGDFVMKRYTCPGDSRTLQVQYVGGFTVALTSYLGISGTDLRKQDGVLFSRSQVTSTEIMNGRGLSNTLMIGERPPSSDLYYGWWYNGAGQWDYSAAPEDLNSGSLDVVLGVQEINISSPSGTAGANCPPGPYKFGPGKLDNISDQFHFWSLHVGGSNFAFADGHVEFIPYSDAARLSQQGSRR